MILNPVLAAALVLGAAVPPAEDPHAGGMNPDHADHQTATPKPVQMKDRTEDVPEAMRDIGIDDSKLNNALPRDVKLVDEEGRPVDFGSVFDGTKPVVLTFVYFRCPAICKPLLDVLAEALATLEMTAGREFELVTVSVDPLETRTLTKVTKQRMLKRYGRSHTEKGWRFWRGTAAEIRRLTNAAGFNFKQVEGTREFAHPATLIILTPDGRVSRYLPGIPENPAEHAKTLKLSLVEASDGNIGSAIDWFVLTCFHFDPTRGAYTLQAQRLMSFGGGATVFLLALFLVPRWLRDARRKRASSSES